jgi:pimeloyl-ACP methyl ester carboxylesterase
MSSPSHKSRILVGTLLLLVLVAVLLQPVAQDYLHAVSLLTRIANPQANGWIADYELHAVETRDESFAVNGQPVPARVYLPVGIGSAPGIVVVHGMHRLGLNEPRLVSFARALAAGGYFVMTPELQGIAEYRVEAKSADVIGRAAQVFSHQLGVSKVGLLCISFSGGLGLMAATDPQYSSSIAWIATIGAYYDLTHVLRFFATGEAVRPDGTVEHLTPHEYGPLIVVLDRPGDFFEQQDVSKAQEAIKLVLSNEGKESEAITAQMTPAGQELMQQIYHQRFDGFRQEILAEINADRPQLTATSPAGRLGAIRMPVLLLHGADDTVIPPTELLWLKKNIPQRYLVDALISPAITHVEVGHEATFREKLALVHWIALMFREARNTPASQRAKFPVGTSTNPAPPAN